MKILISSPARIGCRAPIGVRACARGDNLPAEDVLDQRAGTYSGGVKRRLNLALALLNEPRVLYLDEPTVGIDARSRRMIVDAIAALKQSGVTIIYTSHYMEEVEALCDHLVIIDRGRVVAGGAIGDVVRAHGQSMFEITLAAPAPDALRQALPARPGATAGAPICPSPSQRRWSNFRHPGPARLEHHPSAIRRLAA